MMSRLLAGVFACSRLLSLKSRVVLFDSLEKRYLISYPN
jgi:hypothetical protein